MWESCTPLHLLHLHLFLPHICTVTSADSVLSTTTAASNGKFTLTASPIKQSVHSQSCDKLSCQALKNTHNKLVFTWLSWKNKRARGTYKQWLSTNCVAFEKMKPFHFFLLPVESVTVSCLRSPQLLIFCRRLLPFLVVAAWFFLDVFLSESAIISQTWFMLSLSDASSLSFSEQNHVQKNK